MEYTDTFNIDATLVANEFLDKYMPGANGDFVKVYLFLLRNRVNGIDVTGIADHLDLTEGDVRRAVKYWEHVGILTRGSSAKEAAASGAVPESAGAVPESAGAVPESAGAMPESAGAASESAGAAPESAGAAPQESLRARYRTAAARTGLDRLAQDEEFTQLLMVVQRYLSKILNDNDQQTFAYLYEGLHMPFEVVDYLVQYCVGHGHKTIRYIEKVGIDWSEHGIRDVESARAYTAQFDTRATASRRKCTAERAALGAPTGTDYDSRVLEDIVKKMM